MSHSDSHSQKYLNLYQLRQAAIASTLHSNLAQPIVAAKSFAAAIMSIQGEGVNLQEAQELAGVILEMTDQAYTVAYDLMRENEPDIGADSGEPMQSAIERYGALLRLHERAIKLDVFEDLSSISMDRFVQVVLFDWIKALLIYLTRQTKVSVVVVKLVGNEVGLSLDIVSNIALSAEQLDTELVLVNIRKQTQVLAGTLLVTNMDNQTSIKIVIPAACEMLTVIK